MTMSTPPTAGAADLLSPSRDERDASPSRGIKRQRLHEVMPSSPNEADPPVLADDSMAVATLRISNEMLQSENARLVAQCASLEQQQSDMSRRIQQLEADLVRVYRESKREIENQNQQHETLLLDKTKQIQTLVLENQQLKQQQAKHVSATTAISPETQQVMDEFIDTCSRWELELKHKATLLADTVAGLGDGQVKTVLRDMVLSIELNDREQLLRKRERELLEEQQKMDELRQSYAEMYSHKRQQQHELLEFMEIEMQVLKESVAELEAIKTEKLEQDELIRTHWVIPDSEWQENESERQRLAREIKRLHKAYKLQDVELTRLTAENQALVAQIGHDPLDSSAAQASSSVDSEQNTRLETQIAEYRAEIERLTVLVEQHNKQTSDSQDDRRKRQKTELDELQARVANQSEELARVNEQLARACTKSDVFEQQVQQCEHNETQLRHEISRLKSEIAAFKNSETDTTSTSTNTEERLGDEAQAALPPHNEQLARSQEQQEIVKSIFRSYFGTAERKYQALVVQLESLQHQEAEQRQKAQASLDQLRLCAQSGSCDESIRESIVSVMSNLQTLASPSSSDGLS